MELPLELTKKAEMETPDLLEPGQEVEVKTEEELPADLKVKEETNTGAVEETQQEVVTTEESIDVLNTEENSNVAINYSQGTNVNQVVYHNDGSYIEYAYQVEIRAQTTHHVHVDKTLVLGRK